MNTLNSASASSPKPRSKLQLIQSQAQWAANFCLHLFNSYAIRDIKTSAKTRNLIDQHNKITLRLRASILEDADKNRDFILRETKKQFD